MMNFQNGRVSIRLLILSYNKDVCVRGESSRQHDIHEQCNSGVGVSDLEIDQEARQMKIGEFVIEEGDWISIDGTHGDVYLGLCYELGLDYVSCSPFRVPIARLAAAHAVLDMKPD